MKFSNIMRGHFGRKRRATAIEYGLIVACIAVAIIAVVQGIGSNASLTSWFKSTPTVQTPAK